MEAIVKLRQMSIDAGKTNSVGARHVTSFTKLVGHSGSLDERRLPLEAVGFNPAKLIEMAPLGLKMLAKGKMMPTPHASVENVEDIRRIYREVEGEEKRA
jgi:succinate dehydrogenase / fumarate reductase iron-sulfur subunit